MTEVRKEDLDEMNRLLNGIQDNLTVAHGHINHSMFVRAQAFRSVSLLARKVNDLLEEVECAGLVSDPERDMPMSNSERLGFDNDSQ